MNKQTPSVFHPSRASSRVSPRKHLGSCTLRVETYSSFAYAVTPRAFEFESMTHRVMEISRQWRTPGHIHFYVRDEQNDFFELTYAETRDAWQLRAFGKNCSNPNQVKQS